MRIMTLNGWGGRLFDALAAYLSAAPPDILCLQEVTSSPETEKPWLTYLDAGLTLQQRPNLFAEVAALLPDHFGTFCPMTRGTLLDGEVEVPSFWGLATYVRRSLPVIGQAQGFVHLTYSPDGYGPHPRARSAHVIRVYDHRAARVVTLAQMHGLRITGGKHDTPERAVQATRFLDLWRGVAAPGDLSVLCGDFNLEPDSETFRVFARAGFTELVTAGGHATTRTSYYKKPGRFADYMLVDQPDAVTRFDVVTSPEVSDHCPLFLEI